MVHTPLPQNQPEHPRHVNAYCLSKFYLADLAPATPEEVAAFRAEHPHASFGWLADDP
jgi:hypothetical protein